MRKKVGAQPNIATIQAAQEAVLKYSHAFKALDQIAAPARELQRLMTSSPMAQLQKNMLKQAKALDFVYKDAERMRRWAKTLNSDLSIYKEFLAHHEERRTITLPPPQRPLTADEVRCIFREELEQKNTVDFIAIGLQLSLSNMTLTNVSTGCAHVFSSKERARFLIIEHLTNHGSFINTSKLNVLLSAHRYKDNEVLRKSIQQLNIRISSKLGFSEDLVEGQRTHGYRINPRYKVTISS